MKRPQRLHGLRILVVEDEILVAMILEEMLRDLGCEVIGPKGSVSSALEAIEQQNFDAVILDVNLKGERAEPVANALADHGIPFIFASGYSRPDLPARFASRPFLRKPYESATLAEILKTTLLEPNRRQK